MIQRKGIVNLIFVFQKIFWQHLYKKTAPFTSLWTMPFLVMFLFIRYLIPNYCACAFYFGSILPKILSRLNYTRGKSRASKRRPFPRHPLTSSSRPFAPSGEQTSWTPLWFLIRNSLEITPKALKTLDFLLKQSQRAHRTCVWAGGKPEENLRGRILNQLKKRTQAARKELLGFWFWLWNWWSKILGKKAQNFWNGNNYSHSMVAGGLEVIS